MANGMCDGDNYNDNDDENQLQKFQGEIKIQIPTNGEQKWARMKFQDVFSFKKLVENPMVSTK